MIVMSANAKWPNTKMPDYAAEDNPTRSFIELTEDMVVDAEDDEIEDTNESEDDDDGGM